MPRAVSIDDFKLEFPAFASTDAGVVGAKLDAAQRRCDETVWGDKWTDGIKYLAAHLLSIDQNGKQARLSSSSGSSTYLTEYKNLQKGLAAFLGRVI